MGGQDDNTHQGAVWVYTRSGNSWTQQGNKLIGTGVVGYARQGWSVSLSADGNTAIVGGYYDNFGQGAAWVFIRSAGVWTQQGNKLVGTGGTSLAYQGWSVSLSADGNTAIVGGYGDNSNVGAAWVYTRSAGVWTQQGSKLVGTGYTGDALQGYNVSLSADGNTAIVGGNGDNSYAGAAWVHTRSAGVWTQQGNKLVGTGYSGTSQQGKSVSLSADGNTAIVGGYGDNSSVGAAWVHTRSAGVWTQQGNKLVGTGNTGAAQQGTSVSLSADGNTAIVGGSADNSNQGAAWVYTRSAGVWTQQDNKLVGTGGTSSASQGKSVSLSADGNTAIVGGNDDNSQQGAVWVFIPLVTPTTQASAISFSSVQTTQMTIGWTNGNGSARAVFVKEGTGAITNPLDNTTYTASAVWTSKGTQLGTSGYYCVYSNNTSNSVTLTGLTTGTTYTVQVFEYNGSGGAEMYYTPTATDNPKSQTTAVLSTVTTQAVSGINVTSATGNGNITSLGVPNPTQYGVVWSTSTGPTTALSTKTTQGTASSTGAFTSNITGLTANTLYYVKAYATNSAGTSYGTEVSFTTLQTATATSATGSWSAVAWDHGTPGSSSDVTIGTGTITVDGSYTVKNATVNTDGGLSIGTGQTLNVTGNLVLKSDGTNTASLIINDGGNLNVTGSITVERYMTGNKWYIISSTTSDKTVAQFLTANTNIPTNSASKRGMQSYNTTSNSWNDYFTTGTGNMDAGVGYAARITASGVVNFVGVPTSGDKYVPVSRTGDNGWNCIGNPYTSAIHIDETAHSSNNFLTINAGNLDPSYAAVYVWDESGTNDGNQNYYDVINNTGFSSSHAFLGQDRVQIGQGFFVKANATAISVKFTPAMQIHENALQLKTTKVKWPAVELTVKTDSLSAYTAIAYNERMTLGLDPSYDAGLLRGGNKLNIYSHLVTDNGVDFAIQCLPDKQIEKQVIPIGVDYLKGGQLKISAQITGLPSGTNVVLEDRLNKTFTALNSGNEINVTVDPNTKGIGRFYLHTTALSANDLKTVTLTGKLNAYLSSNNEIRIIGEVSSKAIATLYDTQGKAILNQNLKESNLNLIPTSNIKAGIYLLSVRDTGKLQSFKLFIKQ